MRRRAAWAAGFLLAAAARARGAGAFSDDFSGELSTAAWRTEVIRGRQWRHGEESGEGVLKAEPVADADGIGDPGNKLLDVLTRRTDFGDFTLLCDLRFDTRGVHQDHRLLYLRAQDALLTEPVGYEVHMAVWVPYPDPGSRLRFRRRRADGTAVPLSPWVDYPWEVGRWYRLKLVAAGPRFKLKVWPRDEAEPVAWTLVATDPAGGELPRGAVGFGNYWGASTLVDNFSIVPAGEGSGGSALSR